MPAPTNIAGRAGPIETGIAPARHDAAPDELAAVVEYAYPKVNLTLRVLGRRSDGFHDLDSIAAFATAVADTVRLEPSPHHTTGKVEWHAASVATSGPFGGSIAGENLLAVALRLIRDEAPGLRLGRVSLDKVLPIAAGIGGGSADVAALIRAVQRANPDTATGVDWLAIARRIGADVPVCLASRVQRMRGIGEVLSPLPGLPRLDVVLVNPMVAVPADKTAQVFRALRAGPLPPIYDRDQGAAATLDLASRGALLAHMRATGNDLLPPALAVVPAIGDVLAALGALDGVETVQLSGGGPTCFAVLESPEAAAAGARTIAQRYPSWWVVATPLA